MKVMLEILYVCDTWSKDVENFISYKRYVDDFLWKSLEHIQNSLSSQKSGLISHSAEIGYVLDDTVSR